MYQKRKSVSFLKRMTVLASLLVIGLLSFSCSSDDGGSPTDPGNGKNIKLTITMNGVLADDYLSFVAVGGAANNPLESTVWKVNGVAQSNETAIGLNKDSFTGATKTYVIESITPMTLAKVGMQFLAFGERSYTFSYKAEVNGKVVKEENNITVSEGKDYTHDYTY